MVKNIFTCILTASLLLAAGDIFAASATFKRIWLEHNVSQNGTTGMRVHADFTVWGMKGQNVQAVAYFDSPKGVGVKDVNQRYYTTDGHVCTSENFTPPYDGTDYNDFTLFIPNSELHLPPGKHTYYCRIFLFDGQNNPLGTSEYVDFEGTGSDPAPAAAPVSALPRHFEIFLNNCTSTPTTRSNCPIRVWGGTDDSGRAYCHAAFAGSSRPFFSWNGSVTISGDDFVFQNQEKLYTSTFTLRRDLSGATHHGGGTLSVLETFGPPITRAQWAEADMVWRKTDLEILKSLSPHSSSFSGSESDYSSGSSSSGNSSVPAYRDRTIYEPNYTGKDIRQWCDQCQEWGIPHRHIRERSN